MQSNHLLNQDYNILQWFLTSWNKYQNHFHLIYASAATSIGIAMATQKRKKTLFAIVIKNDE